MQPPNDAQYIPMTEERSHGQPGRFRPAGRHMGYSQFTIPSFPTYDEPVDAANLRAFLKDAAAERLGVTWDFDKPVAGMFYLNGDEIGITVFV